MGDSINAQPSTRHDSCHEYYRYWRNSSGQSNQLNSWSLDRKNIPARGREDRNKAEIGQCPHPRSAKREETLIQEIVESGIMQHTNHKEQPGTGPSLA